MKSIHRRDFLKSSAGALASLSALAYAGAADAPNEKVRVAVVGLGKGMNGKSGRGLGLIRNRMNRNFGDVEVACICDVDANLVGEGLEAVRSRQERAPAVDKDLRTVLDRKDLDAVIVATPDHWHALATVWACQRDKHVYVEKPVSHNYLEGQKMIEVARDTKRLVQGGTQRRSGNHFHSAREFVQKGGLGKVGFVRTWYANKRKDLGHARDEAQPPKGVDYDLWLGPAASRPFNANRFHYEWHWDWDYGTGELGNNGVHALDLACLIGGLDAPTRVQSGGGRNVFDDDRISPDTQVVVFDFPGTTLVWEHRMWTGVGVEGEPWGVSFYGDKGALVFNRLPNKDKDAPTLSRWHVIDGEGKEIHKGDEGDHDPSEAHLRNFFDCVKDSSRKLNCPIETAHLGTRLCHLGNIAYRVGRPVRFDGKTETIVDDAEAARLMGRTYRKPFEL